MPPKRKRPDQAMNDSGARPSPHRPGDTSLGQHDRGYNEGGGRGRGGGRGGRRGGRRDSSQSYHNNNISPTTAAPPPSSPTVARPPSSSSQRATPAPATPALRQPIPPAPPAPIASGYIYMVISDDRLARWTKGGRQEVVDHGVQSRNDEDITEVSTIFQEILHSVVDNRLEPADAGSIVKVIAGPEAAEEEQEAPAFDPRVLFLDTISIFIDVENVDTDPFRAQLRDLMKATEVSPTLMRQTLEPPLLQQLGLIRDTFVRMGIRASTNLLYRQANYNLLREETEGYAKLITELFTTSSTEPPTSDTVQATFERVKGLIGTFDLDVGRVLDVTLDVFAALLIKQFRFFIRFLRVSSWWPRSQVKHSSTTYAGGLPKWALPESEHWLSSDDDDVLAAQQRLLRDVEFWDKARQIHLNAFFELGGRQVAGADAQLLADAIVDGDPDASMEQKWIKATKTLPPPGNSVAAQFLGFKFRFYTSEARYSDDILPANILYLAALLIKVGFISLVDLWPHLWPPHEDMEAVKTKKLEELEEKDRLDRAGGTANALMRAEALPDDMPAPGQPVRRDAAAAKPEADAKVEAEEEKPKLPEPEDQKVHLLKCLLTIGAIPESLFILGQYDWIPQAYPDVIPLIHRVIHHSVELVYQRSRPTSTGPSECPPKPIPEPNPMGANKDPVLATPSAKRPLKWPFPDKADHEGSAYRFYWDEWSDNIPVCQTADDIFTLCDTFLNISGVNIGQDPALLTKLVSIGRKSLAEDVSETNYARWQALLRRLLVPALSLTKSNSASADAVWGLLKLYPTNVRYTIYAEWYEGQISRLEPIRKAFARTRVETLSTMKRLSLTNIPQMARTLAKTAYASPGIVFKVALDQIEAYSNLIEAFVECAKYFTALGYDVLVWSLMTSLGNQNRNRTQETSVLLTSRWLQALARFSGKVFKRYAVMNPTPVVQYVNDQLFRGNSTDLVILKELILTMGGVVSDLDFTDAQLRAMTGGEILRRETLKNLGDQREGSAKSAARLMQALVDTKLAGQLLVNLAQYRQSAIYNVPEEEAHIKLLATMIDDTHQILIQYLDLLRSNLSTEKFDQLVPGIVQLMEDHGLDTGLAFMISRASIHHAIENTRSPAKDSLAKTTLDVDGDMPMDSTTNGTLMVVQGADPAAEVLGDEMILDSQASKGSAGDVVAVNHPSNGRKPDPLLDALQPLAESIQAILPDNNWKRLSAAFYVVFWSLQLGDLALPQSSYEAEHEKLKKQAEDVMKDRSDMTRAGMNKKEQRKRDFLDKAKLIRDEMTHHLERYHKTKISLVRASAGWFNGTMSEADFISDAVIEDCVLPRLLLSAIDAEYSFKMIKFLHENRVPNFKLMSLYDRLFNQNRLRSMIFTCTVREAEHLGRFLKTVLGDLSRWHADKNIYEKEALGLREHAGVKSRVSLGFATAFDGEKPVTFVEHDSFRDLLFRWHKNLNTALRSCLGGMEWMHIRNAITVLKTCLDYFPAITFMADKLSEQLKTITERESASKNAAEGEEGHRVDLSVTAQTAYSELQKRKSKWILVQAFRPGNTNEPKEDTKGPATASTSLRATAPDFKPSQPIRSAADEEDGEVKDSKGLKAGAAQAVPRASTPAANAQAEITASKAGTGNSQTTKKEAVAASVPPRPEPAASSNNTSTPRSIPAHPASITTHRSSSATRVSASVSSHSLPAKPELPRRPDVAAPLPPRLPVDQFSVGRSPREQRDTRDIRDARDSRDPREPRDGRGARDFRAPDDQRPERARDYTPADRPSRPPEPRARDPIHSVERDWASRGELSKRNEEGPPRGRVDALPANRSHDGVPDGRTLRERPTPTPPPSKADLRDPAINSERAQLLADADRTDIINPNRAALIQDGRGPGPTASTRSSLREDSRGRLSRTDSPRRSDHVDPASSAPDVPRGTSDRHHDRDRERERDSRHRHSDYRGSARDLETAPVASRSDRPSERDRDRDREVDKLPIDRAREDRPRDSPSGSHGSRHGDMDHGRHNQQDPNYGRLAPPAPIPSVLSDSPSGPPSGPRGRGGRSSTRLSSMGGGPPSPDRPPPTGPSSSRPPRRSQYEANAINTSSPVTQSGPASVGVHPDRQQQINPSMPAPPPQPASFSGPPSGVHPDRVGHFSGSRGPPGGPPSQQRQSLPPLNTPEHPPSLPHTPGGGDASTPTGPSSTHDRSRNGTRQLRGIQDTLSQAGMTGRSSSTRRGGPGGARMMADSDAQILTGSSPINTPVHERLDPMQREQSRERGPRAVEPTHNTGEFRDSRSGAINGEDHGRGDHERSSRREHRSERGERGDRSGRPSRRSSRERSPDRDRQRDTKDPREFRDRHSAGPTGPAASSAPGGAREAERDMAPPRRTGPRDSTGSIREAFPGNGRDIPGPGGNGREPSHRVHRGDGLAGRVDGPGGRGDGHGGRGDGRGEGPGGRGGDEYGLAGRSSSGRTGGGPASGGGGGPRDMASRPGDDRRGEPRNHDRGRKRPSEDGNGLPGNDRDKRLRR